MKRWRYMVCAALALGMLAFAVPQLAVGGGYTLGSIFAVVWIGFALLAIGSNLHFALGVDGETKERLRQVKRMRRTQLETTISKRLGLGKSR